MVNSNIRVHSASNFSDTVTARTGSIHCPEGQVLFSHERYRSCTLCRFHIFLPHCPTWSSYNRQWRSVANRRFLRIHGLDEPHYVSKEGMDELWSDLPHLLWSLKSALVIFGSHPNGPIFYPNKKIIANFLILSLLHLTTKIIFQFPRIGIYIVMFVTVLLTFLQIMIILLIFLVAFALSFNMVLDRVLYTTCCFFLSDNWYFLWKYFFWISI